MSKMSKTDLNETGLGTKISQIGEVSILCVEGELDIATIQSFLEQLNSVANQSPKVVLDLRKLRLMAGGAIRPIWQTSRRLEASGGQLVLVVTNDQHLVNRILDFSGLGTLVPVFRDFDKALESLA